MGARVLVLHTGGTIGMAAAADGLRPMAGFGDILARQLQAQAALPAIDVVELDALIDSANLRPAHWHTIARELVARWEHYDGFVVLHGTDTMAWSASALSFLLRGADKPVILTGSQIPLLAPRSDAAANLQGALMLATQPIREVGLYFHHSLLRGNRSRKRHSMAFEAFDSPCYPPLAELGIDVVLHRDRLLPAAARDFVLPDFDADAVAVLTLYPGIAAGAVEAVLDAPARRGLVLHSYGTGNVPEAEPGLLAALERAVARGLTVVNVTQCVAGGVRQGAYATGAALERIGVVAAGDMTLEAAFAKLHVLLARHAEPAAVRAQFGEALCGERA
jgi:L-asparaginase